MGVQAPSTPAGRAFATFVTWMNGAGVVWIFALMFLIMADIIGRAAFDHPIAGVTEMVSLSLVACVFLQLGHAVLRGRLMRVEMVVEPLEQRRPSVAAAWQAVLAGVGAVVLVVIARGEWPDLTRAWRTAEFAGVEGLYKIPVWPIKLLIVAGSVVAALELLRQVLIRMRQTAQGRARTSLARAARHRRRCRVRSAAVAGRRRAAHGRSRDDRPRRRHDRARHADRDRVTALRAAGPRSDQARLRHRDAHARTRRGRHGFRLRVRDGAAVRADGSVRERVGDRPRCVRRGTADLRTHLRRSRRRDGGRERRVRRDHGHLDRGRRNLHEDRGARDGSARLHAEVRRGSDGGLVVARHADSAEPAAHYLWRIGRGVDRSIVPGRGVARHPAGHDVRRRRDPDGVARARLRRQRRPRHGRASSRVCSQRSPGSCPWSR